MRSAAVLAPVLAISLSSGALRATEAGSAEPCGEGDIRGAVDDSSGRMIEPSGQVLGNVVLPKVVARVPGKYPERAKQSHVEAKVFLRAVLEKDGSVGCLQTLAVQVSRWGKTKLDPKLDGFKPEFETAAREAVRQWRFEPAREGGEPFRVYFTTFVEFRFSP